MEEIKRKLHLSKLPVLVVALLLVAGLVGGYFFYTNYQKSDDKNSTPAGWVEYKSEKYGFEFMHPKEWGEVIIRETESKTGKQYFLTFVKPNNVSSNPVTDPQSTTNIVLSMDSSDLTADCPAGVAECPPLPVRSANYIKERINKGSLDIVNDNSSFTDVISLPSERLHAISVYQTVNLPKIKVSAVMGGYQISKSSEDCPAKSVSNEKGLNCVQSTNHADMIKVLKSIKSI